MRTEFSTTDGQAPDSSTLKCNAPEPPILVNPATGRLVIESYAPSSITLLPTVKFDGANATLTGSMVSVAVRAGVSANSSIPFYVRKLTIQADTGNSVDVVVGGAAGSTRTLTPGQEYVFEAPDGAKFDLNDILASGNLASISLQWFR